MAGIRRHASWMQKRGQHGILKEAGRNIKNRQQQEDKLQECRQARIQQIGE